MSDVQPPVVSVILPAYNVEAHIGTAIRRLLNQTYSHVEVVVIDDKSEDSTVSEIMRFVDDPRLKLVQLPTNRGVANARNIALEAATGEYVWFVDADDEWSSDFIRTMLGAALEDAADLVVCSAIFRFGRDLSRKEYVIRYRSRRQLVGEDALETLLGGTGALWNKLFKRCSLAERPFPPLRSKSDHGGLLKSMPALGRVSIVPDALYSYVQRDGSISNGGIREPENFLALLPIAEASLQTFPQTKRLRRLRVQFRSEIIARAIRENWRFMSKADDSTKDLTREVPWADVACILSRPRPFLTCVAAKLAPAQARSAFRLLGRSRWSMHQPGES
ncbi:glycosyltransferase family 2 protein [Agromyces sp. Leaf222]|uniref:glycosyltransferase family 2 protein n=1 Tax=Agromyces sp. Leaf222 TaxID=1735688 RepID=UPI0009E80BAF|nr:glycosyltransferase family 2 protein [Agromyces sp. Leaf222]